MNQYLEEISSLEKKAVWLRKKTLEMIYKAKSGHPGGSLSEIEMLVVLYYKIMKINPNEPKWADRDRFILSKGHCCPPLYAILADKGYFPLEELDRLRKYGSLLHGHPSIITPGIDTVSGSLGNGLSIAVGMAMAGQRRKKDYNVYVMLGDGELQEGAVWEAAMCACHHKLNHITAIVDYNGLQINGWVNDIIKLEPLADKWRAFGWEVVEVDGNDIPSLLYVFQLSKKKRVPTVIISHTVKGKGISFMENDISWHGKSPTEEQLHRALDELISGEQQVTQ